MRRPTREEVVVAVLLNAVGLTALAARGGWDWGAALGAAALTYALVGAVMAGLFLLGRLLTPRPSAARTDDAVPRG